MSDGLAPFRCQIALFVSIYFFTSVPLPSILMKGASRYFHLEPETKSSIKRFNQLKKKYLIRFHYVINPLALCIAIFHFLLSSCRKSSLPEWGLIFVTMMIFLGLMEKFKIMIILLVVGHLIVD